MSFALPVKRLHETATLVAFHHPVPGYLVHVLIVPKRAVPSLAALSPADADFLVDLVQTVQTLVTALGLEADGYRVVVNGGANQDVAQLHVHLISGEAVQAG